MANKSYMPAVALLLFSVASSATAALPAKVALQGGRIITGTGGEIAEGTLLIEHGKITAVGKSVDIPYDAMVVDVKGKVLFPGMIAPHSSSGMDRSNENRQVTPYLDVYDSIDPSSMFFEESLRCGVLGIHVIHGDNCLIGGLSRLVHPIGMTPDEMTIQPRVALKISATPAYGRGRMSHRSQLREVFAELEFYLENLAEKLYEDELKKQDKKVDVPPEEARKRGREHINDERIDDEHRNLVKLTEGRLDAWIYIGAATDVAPAVDMARKNGFLDRSVFVIGGDAHRAVDALKEAGRPVVIGEQLTFQRRDPITDKLHETFVPKVIHEAGLQFALQANPEGSLAERMPNYQAARCVRHGIPRAVALKAITVNPANMLGVGDRLGSLEVGKTANVLILSGDPLDFNSWVEKAYVKGILAYDREKDVRLKELLSLPERTAKREKEKKEEEERKKKEAEAKKSKEKDKAADKDAEKDSDEADKKDGEKKNKDAEKKDAKKKPSETEEDKKKPKKKGKKKKNKRAKKQSTEQTPAGEEQ